MFQNRIFNSNTDYIQIIAPSSAPLDAESTLQKAIEFLIKQGFKVKASELLGKANLPYFANSLEKRIESFKNALEDPEVKIIWALRGGYGAAELIDFFENNDCRISGEKILIGFSDITVLHFLMIQKFGMQALHGPVLSQMLTHDSNKSFNLLTDTLFSSPDTSHNLEIIGKEFHEELRGKLVGGNLCVIQTLIGTYLHPKLEECILILEDVGEKGYRIDRMLKHLKQAKILDGVKAIIFGDFTNSDEEGKNYVDLIIQEFHYLTNIPCFRIQDFGHGPHNIPILLGTNVSIKNNKLVISNPFY